MVSIGADEPAAGVVPSLPGVVASVPPAVVSVAAPVVSVAPAAVVAEPASSSSSSPPHAARAIPATASTATNFLALISPYSPSLVGLGAQSLRPPFADGTATLVNSV